MVEIRSGHRVRLHYTARFADGTLFASSLGGAPLEFVAGGNEVILGLSRAVVGMRAGESKHITVPPEQGFGAHDPALEREVPRAHLPEPVKPGDQLSAEAGGRAMAVWVRRVGEESVLLDGNHPLAGQTLIFDFEVIEVATGAGPVGAWSTESAPLEGSDAPSDAPAD